MSSGAAPKFAPDEGIYLYNPNINLVLGSQWQPLVLGVADDGKNLVLELTRIPNVEAVYKEIYTDYYGEGVGYKGGTCSIYWCGDSTRNATHSSITIGSTEAYGTAGAGRLSAYTGAGAVGVSFGELAENSKQASQTHTAVQYLQRVEATSNWTYGLSSSCNLAGCGNNTGTYHDWRYCTSASSCVLAWNNVTMTNCTTNLVGQCRSSGLGTQPTSGSNYYAGSANRLWDDDPKTPSGAVWLSAANANVNTLLGGACGSVSNWTCTSALPASPSVAAQLPSTIPSNNFGSAVIDGLLIQHLKITTKGL